MYVDNDMPPRTNIKHLSDAVMQKSLKTITHIVTYKDTYMHQETYTSTFLYCAGPTVGRTG